MKKPANLRAGLAAARPSESPYTISQWLEYLLLSCRFLILTLFNILAAASMNLTLKKTHFTAARDHLAVARNYQLGEKRINLTVAKIIRNEAHSGHSGFFHVCLLGDISFCWRFLNCSAVTTLTAGTKLQKGNCSSSTQSGHTPQSREISTRVTYVTNRTILVQVWRSIRILYTAWKGRIFFSVTLLTVISRPLSRVTWSGIKPSMSRRSQFFARTVISAVNGRVS